MICSFGLSLVNSEWLLNMDTTQNFFKLLPLAFPICLTSELGVTHVGARLAELAGELLHVCLVVSPHWLILFLGYLLRSIVI